MYYPSALLLIYSSKFVVAQNLRGPARQLNENDPIFDGTSSAKVNHVGYNYALALQKEPLNTDFAAANLASTFPKLSKAKLFGSDDGTYDQQTKDVQALLDSGIRDITVAIGQKEIYFKDVTTQSKVTKTYMEDFIDIFLMPFLEQGSDVQLTIAIGNEPFGSWVGTPPQLLVETYKIVRQALVDFNLHEKVKLTIPFHMGIMANDEEGSPYQAAYFQAPYVDALTEISSIMLQDGNAFFTMNMYTWFAYFNSLTGETNEGLLDLCLGKNGLEPENFMLHGQYLATRAALQKLDPAFANLPLAIGETGWPTSLTFFEPNSFHGNSTTISAASIKNAKLNIENAIQLGFPMYLFEVYDEQKKLGHDGAGGQISDVENHWGVFQEDATLKFDIPALM